jgi:hypothetical protein
MDTVDAQHALEGIDGCAGVTPGSGDPRVADSGIRIARTRHHLDEGLLHRVGGRCLLRVIRELSLGRWKNQEGSG